jgi:ATP-dependent Clp protease ATP-binding subunit ClpC
VDLKLTQSAKTFLIEKGFHPDYGARPLRRAIERHVEDPLAEHLLRGEADAKRSIWVDFAEGADCLRFLDEEPAAPKKKKTKAK